MAVGFSNTNKPINPRGNDASPKGYNRASLFSGKALDFDGVNDFANVVYSDTIGSVWTWSSIIEADALSGYQAIFGGTFGANNGLIVLKNNQLNIYTNTDNLFSYILETGKKYHVALSQSGSSVSAFINGVLVDSVSLSVTLNAGGGSYYIGRNPYSAIEFFNGKMSGVKLFNTALTAAQVADLYNNPEKVVPTGVANTALKLFLPMQEGAGTTAYDGSGNGNHGTISGATYTHGIGAPVSQTAVIDWNKGTNDIGRSQEFDNAYWSTGNITVTANDTTAPDGTTTADKLVATSTSGSNAEIFRNIGLSTSNSISVFAKYDTAQWVTLGTNRILERTVWFDVVNGVVGTESTGYTGEITEYPNGWYKLDVVIGSGATAQTYWDLSIANADGAIGVTAGKSVFAWGAYANLSGTTIGPYLPNFNSYGITSEVLLPQGLTTGRDITGVNLFENVRKQGALNLDGNSWAEVHDNASVDLTDAITLEAWVYWDDASNKGILGRWHSDSNNRNYLFYKNSATTINFYINSSAIASYASLNATKGWTHIVGTYNRTNAVLYIDGVQQATTAHTPAISTGTLPVEIGRNFTTSNQALTAPIAQPRIYNRALTAAEVLQNYNSGKNTYK